MRNPRGGKGVNNAVFVLYILYITLLSRYSNVGMSLTGGATRWFTDYASIKPTPLPQPEPTRRILE